MTSSIETCSPQVMRYMFKLTLFLLLLGVSAVKQQVMKIIIIVELIYLCVIRLLLIKVRRWMVVLLMVFTALERVVRLTLLIVMGKYKIRLRQSKYYSW